MKIDRFAKIPDSIISNDYKKKIGPALWLYSYLKRHMDWSKKELVRKDTTIARDLGVSSKTISRWRRILKDTDLLKFKFTGRYFVYFLSGQNSTVRVNKDKLLESTNMSTPIIKRPIIEKPPIYTEDEINLSKRIAEWGIKRASRPSYKTEEEYSKMLLPHIRRLGVELVHKLFDNETDNAHFWNLIKEHE